MEITQHIEEICIGLREGRFINEAAVSQGIVLRVLQALEWPIFDSSVVAPEYTIEGRRVDYALCHPANKPAVFVEVKQVGQAEGAERQLFEYAFHRGIPMAILTDGQEWHFYLPGEQGRYTERRFYKLDLLERETDEVASKLQRYLRHTSIISGDAIEIARKDYKNIAKNRQIVEAIPHAWTKLIQEQDDLLVELLSDKVESLCGYKPAANIIEDFLVTLHHPAKKSSTTSHKNKATLPKKTHRPNSDRKGSSKTQKLSGVGFMLDGHEYREKSARGVLILMLKELYKRDSTFLSRLAARPKHGRKRRFVAQSKSELYPDRPDLCEEYSELIAPGWWAGTNYSKGNIMKIASMASEVAGISLGDELVINLGE
ncbi:hypothetical protein QUF61_04890 [Candidatus Venteria ishoeyi]|uniref:hypothetical protein n=1 Tax=Candidatus Venteria ishoeyi TaxID=1899563 RepID=UPI0025A4F549|nr:hypothetical protein [Candidatus Venteria ishoeyi]MDM8545806.1 hypothetical protein [Candidatus Venteria ishoeyi]